MIKYTILLCMMLCAPVKNFVSNSLIDNQTIYWVSTENLLIEHVKTLAIQSVLIEDTNKRSVVLSLVEMLLKLIVILVCILLIVITPLLLVFSAIKEFRKLKIWERKLKTTIQSPKSEAPDQPLIEEFKKNNMEFRTIAASLFASSFGLLGWIGFSLSYMILGFKDVSNGFSAYFYFPIKIVETLISDGNLNLNNVYGKSWIYMLGIVTLTVIFYLVGYAIGRSYSSEKILHFKTHAFKTNEERLTT